MPAEFRLLHSAITCIESNGADLDNHSLHTMSEVRNALPHTRVVDTITGGTCRIDYYAHEVEVVRVGSGGVQVCSYLIYRIY